MILSPLRRCKRYSYEYLVGCYRNNVLAPREEHRVPVGSVKHGKFCVRAVHFEPDRRSVEHRYRSAGTLICNLELPPRKRLSSFQDSVKVQKPDGLRFV